MIRTCSGRPGGVAESYSAYSRIVFVQSRFSLVDDDHTTDFPSADFRLNSETARRLYREYGEPQPLLDDHTHLSAADIASDYRNSANYFRLASLEGPHFI